jgi:hypothetical protein
MVSVVTSVLWLFMDPLLADPHFTPLHFVMPSPQTTSGETE